MQDRVFYIQHMQMELNVLKLLAHITTHTHLTLMVLLNGHSMLAESH